MTLNLKSREGLEIFFKLAEGADVVLENYRSDVKHRLGVDYEAVKKINPRIVYGSISGFGQDGPYAGRPGVDQIAQGMGGLMSITGLPGQDAYWVEALNKAGVPCGPINTIKDTFADPQVRHLGIATPIEHAKLGKVKAVGQPIHLSGYPQPDELRPTPGQGQHTAAILGELGYDERAIAGLREKGVV